MGITNEAAQYAEKYDSLACVVCGQKLDLQDKIWVMPTTHATKEGIYAVTCTFECATHNEGGGRALMKRLANELQSTGFVHHDMY